MTRIIQLENYLSWASRPPPLALQNVVEIAGSEGLSPSMMTTLAGAVAYVS